MNSIKIKKTVLPKQIPENNSVNPNKILTIEEEKYIDSLNEKERKAYEIAKSHLGSTFHLIKSNGFIEWKKLNV